MTKQISYFPQGLLLYHAAQAPPVPASKVKSTTQLVQSSIDLQKYVNLAKLKGPYIPEAVLSKVLAKKTAIDMDKFFMSLPNHKISSLTPELRLYKRSGDTITPFYFPVTSDFDFDGGTKVDISKPFSANGAAIESFSVTYTGKNPYTASRKFMEASLKIKVDNISGLFHIPTGNTSSDFAALADLFTIRSERKDKKITGSEKTRPPSALEAGKQCNIVATLGYANHQTDVLGATELRMINENRIVVNMFYRSHDLNMNADGSATVSVSYTGFIASGKGDVILDALTPIESKAKLAKEKVGTKKKEDKKDIKKATGKAAEEAKAAAEVKEKEVQKIKIDQITKGFAEMFNNLYNNNKVYTTQFMNAYGEKAVFEQTAKTEQDGKVTTSSEGVKQKHYDFFNLELKDARNLYTPLRENLMHYVTFGDFLDSYFKVLGDSIRRTKSYLTQQMKENSKGADDPVTANAISTLNENLYRLIRLNVLTCDFKYAMKAENKSKEIKKVMNIADIPISLDTLYGLMYEKLIVARKPFLDFAEFLDDFVPILLTRSFGEFPGADFVRDVTFVVTNFTAPPCRSKIKDGILSLSHLPKPTGSVTKKSIADVSDYFIIHQKAPAWTRAPGSGDKKKDLKNGIFHIRASQDRGFVKSINFSKISQPARETYMMFRNGNMYDELRFPHNATVEMYGNNLFMPNTQVYINPDTLGFGDPRGANSAARRLGFGGYYTAEAVTTTYSAGELTTSMQLFFNCFPETKDQSSLPASVKNSIKDLEQ